MSLAMWFLIGVLLAHVTRPEPKPKPVAPPKPRRRPGPVQTVMVELLLLVGAILIYAAFALN